MKIAITGPHCSGKSTLLRRIESAIDIPNVQFVKFDGSCCPVNYSKKSVINDKNSEIAVTLWMLSKLVLREVEIQCDKNYKKSDVYIFDRCLLDQLVYPAINLQDMNYVDVIKQYIELWLSINPYDLIFCVPKNELFLKKVPNFNQDLDYLDKVEKLYLELFNNLKHTQKILILPPNQDEQKSIIISKIREITQKENQNYV